MAGIAHPRRQRIVLSVQRTCSDFNREEKGGR
jgi:hypothetical protein